MEELQQGIQAAKAGDKATARAWLARAVQRDPNSELAWIWLAQMMDSPAQQCDCLQQALRINPHNDVVRRAIQALGGVVAPPPLPEPEPVIEAPRTPVAPESVAEPEPVEADWDAASFDTSVWGDEVDVGNAAAESLYAEPAAVNAEALVFTSELLEEDEALDFSSVWGDTEDVAAVAPAEGNIFLDEPAVPDVADSEAALVQDFAQSWPPEDSATAVGAGSNVFTEASEPPVTGTDEELDFESAWGEVLGSNVFTEPPLRKTAAPIEEALAPAAPLFDAAESDTEWNSDAMWGADDGAVADVAPASTAAAASADTGGFLASDDEIAALPPQDTVSLEDMAEPEPAFAFVEPEPEGRISLLDRNRRSYFQAAVVEGAHPGHGEGLDVEVGAGDDLLDAAEPEEAVAAEGQPRSRFRWLRRKSRAKAVLPVSTAAEGAPAVVAEPRRFRVLDIRVLFGILGLLDIPIIAAVLFVLFSNRLAPSPSAHIARLCEDLPRAGLSVPTETVGLGGFLMADTVYTASTAYHIAETLVISPGRRLLVEPGAQLVFAPGAALEVRGELFVCGTAADPVMLTAEDKHPGGWEGVRFYGVDAEQAVLNHTQIYFAGERAVYVADSVPSLANLAIISSARFPLSVDGRAFPDLSLGIELRNNLVQGVEIRGHTLPPGETVWPDYGWVYVVAGLFKVGGDSRLTIAPGVIVKVWQGAQRISGFWVRGDLQAEQVQFTSIYDSRAEVGGATLRGGQRPAPGDWGGLTFYESGDASELRNVAIMYAGQQRGAIALYAASPVLARVTVADAAWYPLSADADSFPKMENMILRDNVLGNALEIRAGAVISGDVVWGPLPSIPLLLGEGVLPVDESDVVEGTPDAAALTTSAPPTETEVALVRVIQGTVTVAESASLTVKPGVVVKFVEAGQLHVLGVLEAVGGGSIHNRIVFTSLYDDDYGGNTDGLGPALAERAWRGVILAGADDASVLQNVIVRYGSVLVQAGAPRLINNQLTAGAGPGVLMAPDAQPTLLNNALAGNDIAGVGVLGGVVTADQEWKRLGDLQDPLVRVLLGQVTVAPSVTLRIGAGTVIKAARAGKLVVSGTLQVAGLAHQPTIFTSWHDDTIGGSTDMGGEKPEPGDWLGLEVWPTAVVSLAYTSLRYAETGLTLHGGVMPAVLDGHVEIIGGHHALWCDGAAQVPSAFAIDDNVFNEAWCPARW